MNESFFQSIQSNKGGGGLYPVGVGVGAYTYLGGL